MASLASINVKFNVDIREFSTDMQNTLRSFDKWGQQLQSVGRNLSAFVTLPILGAGGAAVKFASDLEESTNKVDVAFGNSAAAVKDFSETTLTSIGVSKGSALEMASLFGDMSTSMGLSRSEAAKMSTSLVTLAGDLASFKNIGIDQAQTALAGIFTGETESLKRLGVVMTEAALQEYAYSKGIRTKVSDMEQAEKVQLRYNFVMAKTANAQGDFARTGGGAANQMRVFQESLKEIAASLGQVILPVFTKIVTKINEWLQAFNGLSDGTRTVIVVVAGIAAAIGPLVMAIGAISSAIPAAIAGFTALSGAVGLSLGPIAAIAAGLAAVAYVVAKNWEPIKKTLVDIANYFVDLYNNSTVFRGAVEFIILTFKNMWAIAKQMFGNVIATVSYVGNVIYDLFKNLGGLLKSVLTLDLAGLKSALSEGFSSIGKNAFAFFKKLGENGKSTAKEIAGNITTALSDTFNGNKIKKIVIPKEKVDATAVADVVSEAVQSGASGKAGQKREKETALGGGLKSAGLEDVKTGAEIKVGKFNIVDPMVMEQLTELEEKLAIIQEVSEKVNASIAAAFSGMSASIVQSMGLASDGFEGFAGKIIETGFLLISNLIQQAVKNIAIRQAESTANAVAGATASGAASGPLAVFTTPAFIATAIGGVLAAFAAIPKFETGGIIGGSSYYGDKILARVNSGEMIANNDQQRKIFNAMNASGGGIVTMIPELKIKGSDMIVVFNRAQDRKNRIG